MHILSSHNRSEFLAVPQLIRFDYAHGHDGPEPTLLIKGSTLLLKYIAVGVRMKLAFTLYEGRLLCALKVFDDDSEGGILWSFVEHEEELSAIRGLARGEHLVSFLFNELSVNVAWNNLSTSGNFDRLLIWADCAALGQVEHSFVANADHLLDRFHHYMEDDDQWLFFEVTTEPAWKALRNHFISTGAVASLINLFDTDEGNQQEQLAIWLTDNIQPLGSYHSPQIPKGNGTRELTDILLSHEFGAILMESKTLSVFAREKLPNRAKLKRDVSAHITKAFAQLRGAIKSLKSGVVITNPNGDALTVERKQPAHAIVLIPELDLVDNHAAYGPKFIYEFMHATGGYPHILDISELLRIVQAAEMIAARSKTTTPMMALDYYLIERSKTAANAGTLCIEVLLRFSEENPPSE